MKPRNHVVLAMIKASKKSGSHQKNPKSIRRDDKVSLKKTLHKSLKED